ncbi:MAG: GTPase, partial [Actinomycetota bacterium]
MTSLLPAETAPHGVPQPGSPPDAGVDRAPQPDVAARLAALRAALAAAEGYLDPALLARAADVANRAEARLGLSGDATVVALAGATGSGTSALFNALAGLDLSPVGVLRPTTDEPLSCTWGDPGAAAAVQDWLGVPPARRIVRASALDDAGPNPLDGLVLLDLPDHDSVRESHRREVDRLVERVDLLVWVLDPQKYADRAVHERYLQRLAGYDEVLVVVLNQVDRLAPDEAAVCLADLRRLLAADGLPDVPVLPVSARAGLGVTDLRALLAGRVAGRRAAAERLTADLAAAARPLRDACGADGPSEVDAADAAALVTALGAAAGGSALAA